METSTALFSPTPLETAPEGSREALTNVQRAFGMIPNLMATFAHSPAVLNGYLALDAAYNTTHFSPVERQVILLAASLENDCTYCKAAHSTILKGMLKVDAEVVAAIRNGQALADPKHDALVTTVREVVRARGHLTNATRDAFLAAGYEPVHLMELLLGVALKTISNYLDHFSATPLDPAFAPEA
ncbi:MAG: carboxymuconolactone decarboxylase family protein [Fimbriimonadaceae bacterium]|nr:carboxymuconolactone decarboxylase family protein [Fimbriimonadaceae bacterium]